MKRKYTYILASLLIIISVAIISFNDGVSYSAYELDEDLNFSYLCDQNGLSSKPYIGVSTYIDGIEQNGKVFKVTSITSNDLGIPTKSGYTFMGWYKSSGSTEAFSASAHTVTRTVGVNGKSVNIRCFARSHYNAYGKWQATCPEQTDVPVYFSSNGGTSVSSSTKSAVERMYREKTLPKPTRSGYTFDGWYVDASLTKAFNGSNLIIMAAAGGGCSTSFTGLYAKWTAITNPTGSPEGSSESSCDKTPSYTVYYESNGGSYIPERTVKKLTGDLGFTFPTPTRSGYSFDGWYKEASLKNMATPATTGVNFTKKAGSICDNYVGTVYAKWIPVSNGIVTNNTGNGGGQTQYQQPQQPTTTPSADGNTVNVCDSTINTLNITFESNGGEELDSLDICLTCEPEDVSLPQPSKKGKNFVGWYSDESLENEVIVQGLNTDVQLSQFKLDIEQGDNGCNLDVAKTILYARYEDATCSTPDIAYIDINFVKGGDEAIETVRSCLDCDDEFSEMPLVEKEGYLFGGWYIDADYSRLVTKKINLDNAVKYMNVTRNFENECSTDAISTILYAKWIPLEEVKGVHVMFISQGNIVDEKQYTVNDTAIDQPTLKDSSSKLLGWYTDSTYQQPATTMHDILKDVYGAEFRNGQLFVYVFAKTEAVKKPLLDTNKIIIIAIAVIVTIGVGYIVVNESKDKKKKNKGKNNNNNINNNNVNNNGGRRVTWHT